jgi:hypothetical protein
MGREARIASALQAFSPAPEIAIRELRASLMFTTTTGSYSPCFSDLR